MTAPLGPTDYRAAPRLARALLWLKFPRAEHEFIKGDLEEGFAREAALHGRRAARLWYWRQLVSLLRLPRGRAVTPGSRVAPLHSRPPTLDSMFSDLRFALRSLRRAPLFSALVILTLMVGIGATSAVFSVVYPALLAEPPYPEADRLVMIWEKDAGGGRNNVGFLTGQDIRRETRAFSSLAMMSYWGPVLRAEGDARRLMGLRVSHQYFRTLGVAPALGRDFTAEEDVYEARQVVILSHGLWQRFFGADSAVVGRTTRINEVTYQVAGVMPEGFRDLLNPQAELWAPLGYRGEQPWACRSCRHLRAIARLKPGVTREAAEQEIDAYLGTLKSRHPTEYGSVGALLPTLQSDQAGGVRPPLLGLFAAVGLLLLLACANVGNLFLGRSGERENELAVRLALGAERSRLVRLVTLEAGVLAVIGGGLGVLGAWLGTRALADWSAVPQELQGKIALALPVVGFALLVTLLAALAAGTLPAMLALGETSLADLRAGGRALLSRVRHRARNAVVVAEVALAGLLLAAAGLQVRSLRNALALETGFDPQGVQVMDVALRGTRYDSAGTTRVFYRSLLEQSRALPGVQAVAVVTQIPLGGNYDGSGIHREDKPSDNPENDPSAQRFGVSAGYLDAMGIRVLRGRGVTPADREGADPVVLFNRAGAERIFGADDPIGVRVKLGGMDGPWRTVVGIVEDVRHLSIEGEVESQVYLPFDQNSYEESDLLLVIKGPGAAGPVAGAARRLDGSVALSPARSMDELIGRAVGARRLALSLVGGFAVIAIVLAVGGLYGVIAAGVTERIRELGLRAALGATPAMIVRLILGRGIALALLGTGLGLGGLLAAQRLVARFVFGVPVGDPVTLVAVAGLLGVVACLACLVPAIRATRIDPLVALRDS